ncbi:YfjI family protein [bacterium]|nr:YfjI family protein [bacterium]
MNTTNFGRFPVDALPDAAHKLVTVGAKAHQCDESFFALPILSVLAAAIGNTRRFEIKEGWQEPPILWTLVIGESGSGKSPALDSAQEPLMEINQQLATENKESIFKFKQEEVVYKKALKAFEKAKEGNPPEPPRTVEARQIVVSDITVEALAVTLQSNPRGVLLIRDELAGFIKSLNKYNKGGGDEQAYLSMYGARSLNVVRKGNGPSPFILNVERAAVCITGGIQPAILEECLTSGLRESGFAARIMMSEPPRKLNRWSEEVISPAVRKNYSKLVKQLYELDFEDGKPMVVKPTDGAKELYTNYYNKLQASAVDATGELAARLNKISAVALRLALIIHCCSNDDTELTPESMMCGIQIAEWFECEARRINQKANESLEDQSRRKVAEYIAKRGGSITARDLQRGKNEIKNSDQAERVLRDLANHGWGNMQTRKSEKGGPPVSVFALQ